MNRKLSERLLTVFISRKRKDVNISAFISIVQFEKVSYKSDAESHLHLPFSGCLVRVANMDMVTEALAVYSEMMFVI